MKPFAVHRLDAGQRDPVVAHYLALPLKDRWLRFGVAIAPSVIVAYVRGIDFDRDALLGVHDPQGTLAGVAHVAFEDGPAELALSVLPPHRRCGIGTALFRCALEHARDRRVARLCMQFLTDNVPILRIAHRFGMTIVTTGGSAEAHLDLRPAAPAPATASALAVRNPLAAALAP